jgi:hypothetical protein
MEILQLPCSRPYRLATVSQLKLTHMTADVRLLAVCGNHWLPLTILASTGYLTVSKSQKYVQSLVGILLKLIFLSQLVNTATSWPADDVHHYVIPQKLLLTNRFYFQQTSGIHAPVGMRKGCSLSGRSPAPIADSFNVATTERKHSVLNLR